MTFLELVKKLRQKTGGPGTGPLTVVGQTGESQDYVDWINEAWLQIQAEEPYWRWMRKDVSFTTTAGKVAYLPTATAGETLIADWASWCNYDSWRCYKTATGRTDESWLVPWGYQVFRDTYDFGTQATIQGKPQVFSVRDSDSAILLGNTPDAVYTVTGQYQSVPITLAADADVPALPPRFHMLLVYKAMQIYASFEAAPEVMAEGVREADRLMAALRLDQLDKLSFGPPLA